MYIPVQWRLNVACQCLWCNCLRFSFFISHLFSSFISLRRLPLRSRHASRFVVFSICAPIARNMDPKPETEQLSKWNYCLTKQLFYKSRNILISTLYANPTSVFIFRRGEGGVTRSRGWPQRTLYNEDFVWSHTATSGSVYWGSGAVLQLWGLCIRLVTQ
jgi:hypothetical protein